MCCTMCFIYIAIPSPNSLCLLDHIVPIFKLVYMKSLGEMCFISNKRTEAPGYNKCPAKISFIYHLTNYSTKEPDLSSTII